MPDQLDLAGRVALPSAIEEYLRGANPWWQSKPGRVLPAYRRWAFDALLRKIDTKIAPIVVLRGARQVGKTTIQEQAIVELIEHRKVEPRRILRVQFDELPSLRGIADPILAVVRWYEDRVLGETLNETAHRGRPAYLLFDEVQNLSDWAPQLKSLVDHHSVIAVVTGSSALRIEAGRDSLAGRITTIELGTLLLREIAGLRFDEHFEPRLPANGLDPLANPEFWKSLERLTPAERAVRDRAFAAFSERGGYPLVHARSGAPWPEVADQLNETVVRRVIQHDLRMGERGRKRDSALLEEVFRLACRYAGQAPAQATLVEELKRVLRANVGWQRVRSYFQFLEDALLLRLVRPLEIRLKKARGQAKISVLDLGLRASWLEEVVPLDPAALQRSPHLADLAGHLAESAVGAFFAGLPHLDLAHFPARPTEPEVDYVLTIGERRIPMEVKYRRGVDPHRDTLGLRAFIEKAHYNAPFGLLVTMQDGVRLPDPRIIPVSLPSLLWMR
jgi:predicted AAA+ superfamily ATPase